MSHDILIVDDSETIRSMVKRILGMTGLDIGETYEAAHGIEALAMLNDHKVAMVLVDINMPTMNGIQLITRMKETEGLKDIPVVIASTEGSTQRIEQLEQLGVDGFVRKPFRPEQLRDALAPILGEAQHAATGNCNIDDDSF